MNRRSTALADARELPSHPLSYEEFLAWCNEDTWAEWVDGHVILLDVPISRAHQRILFFLVVLFGVGTNMGRHGSVLTEPFQMRLPEWMRRGRSPDLIFVAATHQDRFRNSHLDGPADIVVEIVSAESRRRDREEKFAEYQQAGVREYWIVDSTRPWADFYRLDARGKYVLAFGGASGFYRSGVLPNLALHLEWLWQDPAPQLSSILEALGPDVP